MQKKWNRWKKSEINFSSQYFQYKKHLGNFSITLYFLFPGKSDNSFICRIYRHRTFDWRCCQKPSSHEPNQHCIRCQTSDRTRFCRFYCPERYETLAFWSCECLWQTKNQSWIQMWKQNVHSRRSFFNGDSRFIFFKCLFVLFSNLF